MPDFDQSIQYVVEGDITEFDDYILVGYEVKELAIDTPSEIEEVENEFVENPPFKQVSEASELDLLKAQNKALVDRGDFIEEVIAEMAMMVYV